jgi:uncharacterized protein YbjT (DUF2867 family)
MSKPLLVTGAGGQLGRCVVELLLAQNAGPVIAATRDPDKIADLRARGAEVRRADFDAPGCSSARSRAVATGQHVTACAEGATAYIVRGRAPGAAAAQLGAEWGERDRSHRRTDPESLRTLIPHAHIVRLPESGHFPNLEQPDIFLAALRGEQLSP